MTTPAQLDLAEDEVVIERELLEEIVWLVLHPRSPAATTARRHVAIGKARVALSKLTRRSA